MTERAGVALVAKDFQHVVDVHHQSVGLISPPIPILRLELQALDVFDMHACAPLVRM